MKFYDVEQGTEEWLNLRLGKFTASTFSDLLMEKKTEGYKKAIIKVAYERIKGESEESFVNAYMKRGTDLEPFARENYELETFSVVENGGFWEYNEYVGCSPDGKIKGENGGVEFKCPSNNVYENYMETGRIANNYYIQMQGQLLCTGWDFIDYYPFSSPFLKAKIQRVTRDSMILDQLKQRLKEAIFEVELMIEKRKR